MDVIAAYAGLFTAAFLAATILPAQSEAVLVLLMLDGRYSVAALLFWASLGNVLGSATNWVLGRAVERFRDKPWFPVSPAAFQAAEARYARWGYWSLLLTWVPIIGDPLAVISGVMREPLWRFLVLVTIAKAGRYIVLAAGTVALMG